MNVLVVGYYGYGNVGDDVCLEKTKIILNTLFDSPTIWILSSSTLLVDYVINRWNFFSLIKTIFSMDRVVFGGGGLLQNKTSQLSLLYYLSVICVAKIFNKKVLFLGQGVGPIYGDLSIKMVRWFLTYVYKSAVRSKESLSFFKDPDRVILASDLAFYKAKIYVSQGGDHSKHVGINLCDQRYPYLYPALISIVLDFGFYIHGISFCRMVDTPLLVEGGVSQHDIIDVSASSYYQQSEESYAFILCMRYHSCVWAILQGIPFIALAYDDKVLQLANFCNQPVLALNKQTPLELKALIESSSGNFSFYQGNIMKGRHDLLQLSELNEWVLS